MDDLLDPQQIDGLTDVDPDALRVMLEAVVDVVVREAALVEERAVFPAVEPGAMRAGFPGAAPCDPEPLSAILADVERLVVPGMTRWDHPGFFAYFPSGTSAAGLVGEVLMSALAQNTMLWRTSPIGTELEEVVVGWLRDALGLPPGFDGFLTDTASTSTLIALAAAREAAGLDAADLGLAGRPDIGVPRVYCSQEAHSSVEKAAMTLGIGRANVVRVPTDEAFRMQPAALAASIAADRAAGHRPMAIVATIGTTATTSIDPVAAIATIAEREDVWLHVDAAYAGVVALLPDRRAPFDGWERADSIVVNPHKWLFTQIDASLLLTRRMPDLRTAFSLVPEYLRTVGPRAPGRDINEYTPQLGRRFRALKLWVLLRWFGLDGLRRRIGAHLAMAADLAARVEADPDLERLAPTQFSTVCLRYRPATLVGREDEPAVAVQLDELNAAVMEAVNRTGEVFLSHARLRGRFAIRVAIGQIRTEQRHVERVIELVRREGSRLADPGRDAGSERLHDHEREDGQDDAGR